MEALLTYLQTLDPFLLYVVLALFVFLVVKILSLLGFLKDGTYQRIGVILGTLMTSEMLAEAEKAIGAILVGLISVAMNELAVWAGKKLSKSE